jgi:hypothetical protein
MATLSALGSELTKRLEAHETTVDDNMCIQKRKRPLK